MSYETQGYGLINLRLAYRAGVSDIHTQDPPVYSLSNLTRNRLASCRRMTWWVVGTKIYWMTVGCRLGLALIIKTKSIQTWIHFPSYSSPSPSISPGKGWLNRQSTGTPHLPVIQLHESVDRKIDFAVI
jgi:hypothetical protein